MSNTLPGRNKEWVKEDLEKLYLEQNMNMAAIARLKGVTRERMRQIIRDLGIPSKGHRVKLNQHRYRKYANIEAFFDNCGGLNTNKNGTFRQMLPPELLFCCECGSRRNVHIHHLVYPALSMSDIMLLCASCHKRQHVSNINHKVLLEIFFDRMQGLSYKDLGRKYQIPWHTIAYSLKVVAKELGIDWRIIRYNNGVSIKEAAHQLGIKQGTLLWRISTGKVPCERIAGKPVISFATLEQLKNQYK